MSCRVFSDMIPTSFTYRLSRYELIRFEVKTNLSDGHWAVIRMQSVSQSVSQHLLSIYYVPGSAKLRMHSVPRMT